MWDVHFHRDFLHSCLCERGVVIVILDFLSIGDDKVEAGALGK